MREEGSFLYQFHFHSRSSMFLAENIDSMYEKGKLSLVHFRIFHEEDARSISLQTQNISS
jgi:hypothetical protein